MAEEQLQGAFSAAGGKTRFNNSARWFFTIGLEQWVEKYAEQGWGRMSR